MKSLGRWLRERCLVGLNVVAVAAGAERRAGVEGFDGRAEIALDVHGAHGQAIELPVTAFAEPEQGFLAPGAALDLDDQAPRIGGAMRRVRRVSGNEQHLALLDDGGLAPAALDIL